jgi:hypothetical protein
MTADRNTQVLLAGLRAAHEQMFSDKGLQKPEYPRNFKKLYGYMEDSLYELFDAVQQHALTAIVANAADIMVNASKIIEYAELMQRVADKPWNATD